MYQRVKTTIQIDANSSRSVVEDGITDWEADKEYERRRLSAIALGDNSIQTVEEGTHSLVVLYNHGTVKVFNWVEV